MDAESKSTPLHENLDTAFVNLWSLLRSLSRKGFVGRVHVELTDYSADIFMDGSRTPLVHEIDCAAGTETLEEAALHRLVLRARETPGTISVFEGADEAAPRVASTSETGPSVVATSETPPSLASTNDEPAASSVDIADELSEEHPEPEAAPEVRESIPGSDRIESAPEINDDIYPTGSYHDWPAILATSGELIGAIERGINAAGADFDSLFRAVRLELADDYSFLDPISRVFEYSSGAASLTHEQPVSVYVSGLSEALRRTVDRVAIGARARRVRERVALEMLAVARKHGAVLERSGLQAQLDRIAGTRVM
jgi:hypothetical protein